MSDPKARAIIDELIEDKIKLAEEVAMLRDELVMEQDAYRGCYKHEEEMERRAERAEKQARELAEAIENWKTIGIDKRIERYQATDAEKKLVEALVAYQSQEK